MHLDFSFLSDYWPQFLAGSGRTILLTATVAFISLPCAFVLASIKNYSGRLIQLIISLYVNIIRNTPILIQMFFIFFGLPVLGVRASPNMAAVVGMTVYSTAYLVEVIRSGILSVSKGQIEAGTALGLGRIQVFRHIVFLPALRAIYPALTSQFIMLLLTSSIVSAISASDLTTEANLIQSITFRSFEVYIVIAVIYFSIGVAFIGIFSFVEKLIFSYPLAK